MGVIKMFYSRIIILTKRLFDVKLKLKAYINRVKNK